MGNGLNVFPDGTLATNLKPYGISDVPPPLCKKSGGATFRIKCNDDGYPITTSTVDELLTPAEITRAYQKKPGKEYTGKDFFEMSENLNQMLKNSGVMTKDCSEWSVEELQKFQEKIFMLRHEKFNDIYKGAG